MKNKYVKSVIEFDTYAGLRPTDCISLPQELIVYYARPGCDVHAPKGCDKPLLAI